MECPILSLYYTILLKQESNYFFTLRILNSPIADGIISKSSPSLILWALASWLGIVITRLLPTTRAFRVRGMDPLLQSYVMYTYIYICFHFFKYIYSHIFLTQGFSSCSLKRNQNIINNYPL
jgi:uncharacterized membrane protein